MPKNQSDINAAVGRNVSNLLEKKNQNNYIICAILDLKPSNVSDLLSGKVNWKLDYITSIAEYFGVTTDMLIFGDPDHIKKHSHRSQYEFKGAVKEFLVREKKYKTLGELTADGYFDILSDKPKNK